MDALRCRQSDKRQNLGRVDLDDDVIRIFHLTVASIIGCALPKRYRKVRSFISFTNTQTRIFAHSTLRSSHHCDKPRLKDALCGTVTPSIGTMLMPHSSAWRAYLQLWKKLARLLPVEDPGLPRSATLCALATVCAYWKFPVAAKSFRSQDPLERTPIAVFHKISEFKTRIYLKHRLNLQATSVEFITYLPRSHTGILNGRDSFANAQRRPGHEKKSKGLFIASSN